MMFLQVLQGRCLSPAEGATGGGRFQCVGRVTADGCCPAVDISAVLSGPASSIHSAQPFSLTRAVWGLVSSSLHLSQFWGFAVSSLDDFKDVDSYEMLLCPIRPLQRFLSKKEQLRPACFAFFIWMIKNIKRVSWNTTSFWVRLVIFHA